MAYKISYTVHIRNLIRLCLDASYNQIYTCYRYKVSYLGTRYKMFYTYRIRNLIRFDLYVTYNPNYINGIIWLIQKFFTISWIFYGSLYKRGTRNEKNAPKWPFPGTSCLPCKMLVLESKRCRIVRDFYSFNEEQNVSERYNLWFLKSLDLALKWFVFEVKLIRILIHLQAIETFCICVTSTCYTVRNKRGCKILKFSRHSHSIWNW